MNVFFNLDSSFRNKHLTLDPFSTVTASSQDVQVLLLSGNLVDWIFVHFLSFQSGTDNGNRHKTSNEYTSVTNGSPDTDWEVPIIDEEALDRLTTMFTIYTT